MENILKRITKVRTNVYLTVENRKALLQESKLRGITAAELLRQIIDEHFAETTEQSQSQHKF
jgi:GMP synthase PP-ATPase subunit